jgi:CRISPR-associated endoribonuclease Cas6
MRLLVNLSSTYQIHSDYFNKYYFQGALYSFLINTKLEDLHNNKSFKFFTFSDFFPSGDLLEGGTKSIIVSSPNKDFIKTLHEKMLEKGYIYLLDKKIDIKSLKIYEISWVPKSYEIGSPIVLQINTKLNKYFSFRDNGTIAFYLRRLKENAIKKYKAYYKLEDFSFEETIFDSLMFKKEIAVNLQKSGKKFITIGSMWYYLNKNYIPKKLSNFYKFILDSGLGEKNSLGFGFLNPRRSRTT